MSRQGIYLREFARSVPTCFGYESLGAIFEVFYQSRADCLVLVNPQHHPLGIVHRSRLLPLVSTVVAEEAAADLKARELGTTLQDLGVGVVMPLTVAPAEWTLAQFLAAVPLIDQEYALVDQEAQFVGMLDRDRLQDYLLQALLKQSVAANGSGSNTGAAAASVPTMSELENLVQAQQQQILSLTQQLLVQRVELEQRLKVQSAEIYRLKGLKPQKAFTESIRNADLGTVSLSQPPAATVPSLINVLLQLLERLPLPLMLQTNSGQVLAQNLVWCQQIGSLADPAKIWHEASIWLGTESTGRAAERASEVSLSSIDLAQQTAIASLPLPPHAHPANQSLCQLGPDPDSCVCVCALKDGHERVVQFVKISLGTLLPNLELDWATPSQVESEALEATLFQTRSARTPSSAMSSFQLATLIPSGQNFATQQEGCSTVMSAVLNDLTRQTASPPWQSLWLVMTQDVTQQQHLARELTAKNADLVQLNRLKDEFLACISHELKTPLTAVLGLSSLLKDQTLGKLNQRQVHYAELIYQSSRHLMSVVNDILDLTRIETGQLELLYGTVDIPTVCSRAFEQAKQARLAENKNSQPLTEEQVATQFSLEIEPNLGSLIADELRLRQMLVHLLSNSLKFTHHNSPMGLKVSRWGGWIAFTVWDTGIGIPADKQHLIFQKFQQLENPLTRQFEGAGLGLVLTRRLARLHGGDVTFISKEEAGSQFTILLPPTPPDRTQLTRGTSLDLELEAQSATIGYPGGRVPLYSCKEIKQSVEPIALSPAMRDRLVLIVDAVPQFVESLTDQLTGLGYRVVIARSGTEALEKARRLQPCVIFLNPLLPLLSGWDVLTLLKSSNETQDLPVVVTATVIEEEKARQNQADGFLKLPIQPSQLQVILRQLLLNPEKQEDDHLISKALTILRLFHGEAEANLSNQLFDLSQLLQSRQYRILESDDLEQAELLARVWHPHVLLLEGTTGSTLYLQHLSRCPMLAALPIVTVDAQTAQVANQIGGLKVYPCLLNDERLSSSSPPDLSTLLQVIQIAAGCPWQPSVLAADISLLTQVRTQSKTSTGVDRASASRGAFPHEAGWLQALIQYLQTAGLEALIGQSWQEVMQQLTSQSVDLLLLCWTHGEPQPFVLDHLTQLRDLDARPPIIVLDHRDPELGEAMLIPLPAQIRELATLILSPPIAMAELLEQIQQTLR